MPKTKSGVRNSNAARQRGKGHSKKQEAKSSVQTPTEDNSKRALINAMNSTG